MKKYFNLKFLVLFSLFSIIGIYVYPQFFSTDNLIYPSENTSHRHAKVTGIPISQKLTVANLEGPGIINHIWITTKSVVPQIQGLLVLRVWWDDEKEPSIETPLGDFFGVGFGKEKEFKSAMLEMFPAGREEHASLNCYWKMPFKKSARFEIENRSFRSVSMFFIQIDYEKVSKASDDVLYFHAQFRRENPVTLHKPYTILEAEGLGNYVGTILNYHLLGPGAWVEGAQEFFIDGETSPSLEGTGSEDYFGHAWGFRFENNSLFHGTSYGIKDNKMTAYRFHIPDPVRFKKSIKATIKCHGWDVQDREDDYSSVALWYQNEPHKKFPPLPSPDYDYLEIPAEYRRNPLDILNDKRKNIRFTGKNLSLQIKDYKESGHYEIDGMGSMAFDGDIGTKWCEIENPNAHWLAVDLGKLSEIEGFILINPSACGDSPGFDTVGFRIEKGDTIDGKWELIKDINTKKADKEISEVSQNQKTDTDMIIIPLEKPIMARYIRLYIYKSCELDPICRVQEFEIWGR